jgi:hypothetical protein
MKEFILGTDFVSEKPEVRAQPAPWARSIMLLIRCGNATAETITMRERDPHTEPKPSLWISHKEAQTLMDDLWQCGLRPTEGAGSAGALAATKHHLDDMRKLVFEELRSKQ